MATPVNDDLPKRWQPDHDSFVQLRLVSDEEIEANASRPEEDKYDPKTWRYWFITAYEVSRQYGGPEEGGWYYDAYSVIETKEAITYEEAEEIKTQMEIDLGIRKSHEGIGGRAVPGEPVEQHRETKLVNPADEVPDDYEPINQAEDESYVYDSGELQVVIEREAGELSQRERPYYE